MSEEKELRIENLIELAEKIYKQYGNIKISLLFGDGKAHAIRQVGVASTQKEDPYMCLSTFIPGEDVPLVGG